MLYGHAGRTLALIRQVEAGARQLSGNQILPGQRTASRTPPARGGTTITPQTFRTAASAISSHSPISNAE